MAQDGIVRNTQTDGVMEAPGSVRQTALARGNIDEGFVNPNRQFAPGVPKRGDELRFTPTPEQLGQRQPIGMGQIVPEFIPDTSKIKPEDQIRREYAQAQADAKTQRDAGFMGRVVLPGEMSYDDFRQTNQYELIRRDSNMTTQDTTLAGKTGEELEKALVQKQTERVDDASLPSEQTITPTKITEKAGEIVSPDDFKTPEAPQVESAKPLDVSDYTQQTPEAFAAPTVTAAKLDDITPVDAATLDAPSAQAIIKAAQGKPSPESLAIAATEELDPRATVKYQLAELYKSLEDGQPLPAWASPAVRKATALMKQRGLGASSMAAAATIQALAESGIVIASADADKYARIQLQNLSNQQQAVLQNATVFAQMDLQNLNNRQTAAVNNAKTFLTLDVQNLTNEQQAATLNYQGQVQALLQDSKQENAARQFNAKNQTQVETFFADLGVQIESATLNRKAAIEQYNMSQTNAISQFNSQMKAARDQFNSSMTAQIAQSNAQWRRDVNTVNTATQNAANQQNAMNLLGLSQQSMANLWQLYRDQAAWTMSTSENNLQRAHNAAMQSMVISANSSQYDDEFEDFLIIRTIDNIWGD